MSRHLHRCFASTGTMLLWELFLVALTATYFSVHSFAASWGGLHWERQILASASPGSAEGAGLSVLVTAPWPCAGAATASSGSTTSTGTTTRRSRRRAARCSAPTACSSSRATSTTAASSPSSSTSCRSRTCSTSPPWRTRRPTCTPTSRASSPSTRSRPSSGRPPPRCTASTTTCPSRRRTAPTSRRRSTPPPRRPARRSRTRTTTSTVSPSPASASSPSTGRGADRTWPTSPSPATSSRGSQPITVYRGRDHVDLARDFTYIDDIVRGCLALLDTDVRSTGTGGKKRGPAPYRIYNLGNTSPVTVPSLVSILETYLRMKAKKNVIEMPGNGDVPFTHANISLAREELGYKPTTSLDVGFKKFVRYLSYYGYNRGTHGFENL